MDQMTPTFRPGIAGLVPDAWILRPANAVAAPPVVVVHGITRGVEEMRALLAPRALATGRTLVLPHFSQDSWPRYQRAACKERADWALLRLMERLRLEGHIRPGRFDMAGFSGGAQFAHRFAWLYPQSVAQLCLTAPGWWTFPDAEAAWPYGMAAPRGRDMALGFHLAANMRAFLDRQITVCVGSDDIDRDANLRQGAAIDAQQGHTRARRAQRWVEMAQARARALGLAPKIAFRVLQGCDHSFTRCVTHAGLDRDFIPQASPCAGCKTGGACRTTEASENLLKRNVA